MKRVILTLAVLGVLSLVAGEAMAAGVKVRSSRGIPILGHAPASSYAQHYVDRGHHGPRHHSPGHYGPPGYYYGRPSYGYPYMRPPIVVQPRVYPVYPYYGYPVPYRGFSYDGRGLSLSFGF